MKLISIVTPCYNEKENIYLLYEAVKKIMNKYKKIYAYEHIIIDNSSNDGTIEILRDIAKKDNSLKIIINIRNFGHIRSPYHALINTNGDASIMITADFQDPPELIDKFIKEWNNGYKIIVGVKNKSNENPFVFFLRKIYYFLMDKFSETPHISNFTGFGLYDKSFISQLKKINDPYPYLRGLVAEYGLSIKEISFKQPKRLHGKSKNNLFSLFDNAMLGFVNHTKIFLRMATIIGFTVSFLSLLVALGYLVAKILYWNNFDAGISPLIIGLFFFISVQLFFIGIIGEYIGSIYTHIKNRPLVIEKERINFED